MFEQKIVISLPRVSSNHVTINLITGLPESAGEVDDTYSGDLIALICIRDSKKLFDLVFMGHVIPDGIVLDRGPQLISQVWQALCSSLGTSASLLSGYHPESNGAPIKRLKQRSVTHQNISSWAQFLPRVKYAINTHASSDTCLSPFEVSKVQTPVAQKPRSTLTSPVLC